MPDRNPKGTLRPLALPQILRHLCSAGCRGALVLACDDQRSVLLLEGARLVDAVTSRPDAMLSHRLMEEGVLSPSAYDALQARMEAGESEGQALVEMSILDPTSLWERTEAQVRDIATEPFTWEQGEYGFIAGQRPGPGRFRQRLSCVDLTAAGIRRVRDRGLFRDVIPSGELAIEAIESGPDGPREECAELLPYERYVRDLLDGTRTVADVAALSELGRFETCRALFLLMSTGHARPVLAESGVADDARGADLGAVLIAYNGMFTSLQQHLRREVGPIAVQMLERCLREARAVNPSLLDGGRQSEPPGRRDAESRRSPRRGPPRAQPAAPPGGAEARGGDRGIERVALFRSSGGEAYAGQVPRGGGGAAVA